jgi:hypothetical protein
MSAAFAARKDEFLIDDARRGANGAQVMTMGP